MEEESSPLPGGRVISGPYILIVFEGHKIAALKIASNPRSGCLGIFIHNYPPLGEWTVSEGIPVSTLLKDRNLRLEWLTTSSDFL